MTTEQDFDDMINEDAELLAEMEAAADEEVWGLYDDGGEVSGEGDAGHGGAAIAGVDDVADESMDVDMDADEDNGDSNGGDDRGDSSGSGGGGGGSSDSNDDGVAAWEAQAGWRGATGVQVGGMKQRTTNGMAGEVVGSGPGKRRRITTFMQWDALPWRQMCAALAGETADVTGD